MKIIQLDYVATTVQDAYHLMFKKKGKIQYIDKKMARELNKLNDVLYDIDVITLGRYAYTKGKILMGLEDTKTYKPKVFEKLNKSEVGSIPFSLEYVDEVIEKETKETEEVVKPKRTYIKKENKNTKETE